jgi:hypothetical protein
MTRHQAKGREMDAIVLVHHDIDFEPIGLARRASELRLIYVAVSRARGCEWSSDPTQWRLSDPTGT